MGFQCNVGDSRENGNVELGGAGLQHLLTQKTPILIEEKVTYLPHLQGCPDLGALEQLV